MQPTTNPQDPTTANPAARLRLPISQTAATPAALDCLLLHRINPTQLLVRWASGDWGTIGKYSDGVANIGTLSQDSTLRLQIEAILAQDSGCMIMGEYRVGALPTTEEETSGTAIWIIGYPLAEGEAQTVTIMLPEEY
jgi:hypothetical protein